jgi:hypothetical protein
MGSPERSEVPTKDLLDEPKLTKEELEEKICRLKEMMKKNEDLSAKIEKAEDSQISLTDPVSRRMAVTGKRRTSVGYNVQACPEDLPSAARDHRRIYVDEKNEACPE